MYLKNEHDSLEAIQEVAYRSWKGISSVKSPEYFSTWLMKIMMNYCVDELNRKKRIIVQDEFSDVTSMEDIHTHEELEEAIDTLDGKCKQVIILKYFHDLRISDIAIMLECPEGTIKTWLNKALMELRKYFNSKEGENHV